MNENNRIQILSNVFFQFDFWDQKLNHAENCAKTGAAQNIVGWLGAVASAAETISDESITLWSPQQ